MSVPQTPRKAKKREAPPPLEKAPRPTELALPIGPRVVELLEVAYRARRPVLLEGPTGIGKSQIVSTFAAEAGIDVIVLDLSLLEPPDLIGLPVIENGRTRYASPAELPTSGRGVLMLEELNRAEIFVMQPALQLLSARRLHSYELPPGWSCVAAVNPEDSDYQVNHLDTALRTRFMQLSVSADRATWLPWAASHNVHPVIVSCVREHDDAFEHASPRSWTYASDVLHALGPLELRRPELVRVALRGFLPTAWSLLVAAALDGLPEVPPLDLDALLARGGDAVLARVVGGLRVDAVAMTAARLRQALARPETRELARTGVVTLASLERLFAALPGDLRDQCLDTAVASESAPELLAGLAPRPAEIARSYVGSPLQAELRDWRKEMRLHRVRLVVLAVRRWLDRLEEGATELAEAKVGLAALVRDAGVLADDLARSLRARGVEP